MTKPMIAFSHEQLRAAANLAQYHEAWLDAARTLHQLPYGMAWKTSAGRQYLYELRDRSGNGQSLGLRSAQTEARHRQYQQAKADASERAKIAEAHLRETSQILRALRAPAIAP